MKTIKKTLSVLLAVMLMTAAMVVPASAAGDYTITINNTAEGHVYTAYQIFTGDLSSEGVLSNIEWGTGVNGDTLLVALKADSTFGTGIENEFSACANAAAVARELSGWSPDSLLLDRFAELVGENLGAVAGTSDYVSGDYIIDNMDAGYYLIMDTVVPDGNVGDAYTKYIIRVVRDVDVSPKGSVPTVDKKVHTALNGTYKEYEDLAMTYSAYYKLEGTLPSNYVSDYAQYYYQFSDTLPAGMTYDKIEDVYILHSNDTTTPIADTAYTATLSGQILNVIFDDLKVSLPGLLSSDKIVVKYSAVLNENAVIGGDGNINQVVLIYSNDPNEPADVATPSLGHTAVNDARVYTYQVNVTKVDSIDSSKVLAGAQFRLYRNAVEGGVTTKIYAIVDNGTIVDTTRDEAQATTLVSDSNGQFSVAGLDAGIYYLEETKAPSGYNTITDPVRVTITPEYADNELNVLKYDVDGVPGTGNASTGVVSIQIKNNAGATLPSTGGMGTTVFYVMGGALVVGALAVIMVRKRSEAK